MPKDTKSSGYNKAPACESRGFGHKKEGENFDTPSLRTCMQGGTTHDGEQELINSLRYGLLSRERIISKEDIKSYLLHKLGKYVESVEVGNGVAISPDSKKGLIRVTEIKIKLGQFDKDEIPNLEELAHYLEKDLTERSVCNSNYKIKFV